MSLLKELWRDQDGAILNSAELIFLAAILVLGIVPGIFMLRSAIIASFQDAAQTTQPQPQPRVRRPTPAPDPDAPKPIKVLQ
jgi:hypothetical protein